MPRMTPIDPANATGRARELLDTVQSKLGKTPNMMRTMAQSPAVLDAYLSFAGALGKGSLGAKVREQIALATGEANDCGYCVAAHSILGGLAGLKNDEIDRARRFTATDPKVDAILKLSRTIIETRGELSDEDLRRARTAGLNDGEIAEVVATTAFNIFTNYFNHIAKTELDFPQPRELAHRN